MSKKEPVFPFRITRLEAQMLFAALTQTYVLIESKGEECAESRAYFRLKELLERALDGPHRYVHSIKNPTCFTIEVDGRPVRVYGDPDMSKKDQAAVEALARAAKESFARLGVGDGNVSVVTAAELKKAEHEQHEATQKLRREGFGKHTAFGLREAVARAQAAQKEVDSIAAAQLEAKISEDSKLAAYTEFKSRRKRAEAHKANDPMNEGMHCTCLKTVKGAFADGCLIHGTRADEHKVTAEIVKLTLEEQFARDAPKDPSKLGLVMQWMRNSMSSDQEDLMLDIRRTQRVSGGGIDILQLFDYSMITKLTELGLIVDTSSPRDTDVSFTKLGEAVADVIEARTPRIKGEAVKRLTKADQKQLDPFEKGAKRTRAARASLKGQIQVCSAADMDAPAESWDEVKRAGLKRILQRSKAKKRGGFTKARSGFVRSQKKAKKKHAKNTKKR